MFELSIEFFDGQTHYWERARHVSAATQQSPYWIVWFEDDGKQVCEFFAMQDVRSAKMIEDDKVDTPEIPVYEEENVIPFPRGGAA